MLTTFIYTLSDPNGEIRYVGKSNSPKKRLYDHLNLCEKSGHTHKNNWIKSLLKSNKIPILNIIDEVPIDNWQFWEIYWIRRLKDEGCNLTNKDIGGNGTTSHGYNTREKMKIRHKEFPNYNGCQNKSIIIQSDILYQKYIIENLSIPKIAKLLNVSEKKIFSSLKEYKIKKDKSIWKKQCSSRQMNIVFQYDTSGNFIKEWNGLVIIESELGINKSNIANCCRDIIKSAGGFIWRYEDKWFDLGIDKIGIGNRKKVNQYDLSGNLISEFRSLSEASDKIGVMSNNIQDCCVGRLKSAGGFIWKYSEDKSEVKYNNRTLRSVIQYDLDMNFISEYPSIIEASNKTGSRSNCIQMCCVGKYKHSNSFIWKYK